MNYGGHIVSVTMVIREKWRNE